MSPASKLRAAADVVEKLEAAGAWVSVTLNHEGQISVVILGFPAIVTRDAVLAAFRSVGVQEAKDSGSTLSGRTPSKVYLWAQYSQPAPVAVTLGGGQ